MKLSLNWIKEFVNLDGISERDIITKINSSICETEEVYPYLPHLEKVQPVEIVEISSHPQADKLRITQVRCGNYSLQIVTNSQLVSVGDIVPCAMLGATINGVTIQTSELRGIQSAGMFCSAKDIGIFDNDTGVFILNDKNLPIHSIQGNRSNLLNIEDQPFITGEPISWQLGFRDTIIDIDNKSITHRPDLWSHFGFARELGAQFSREMIQNPLDSTSHPLANQGTEARMEVVANDLARSYYTLPISNVSITSSKMKFRSRILKSGIKSISNVVDVSNYILLEVGQPTHFFDRGKLLSNTMSVSRAQDGESFLLLDDSIPKLTDDIVLIRNGDIPVAIAGVMGGMDSAVFNSTKEIVLESAIFHREEVRNSVRKIGIRSDSAIRYEKGLDTSTCIPVIHRAIQLMKENGNPNITLGTINGFDNDIDKQVLIDIDLVFFRKKIGKFINSVLVEEILNKLGFQIIDKIESVDKIVEWKILVPRYRHSYDITIPEDLVEEVGRTIGYENIETLPLNLSLATPIHNPLRDLEKKLRNLLSLELGYNEVFNYSFQSPSEARFEKNLNDSDIVFFKNDMPPEHSVLRTSIYPSLLKNATLNQDRFEEIGIYEIGRTYHNSNRDIDGLPNEKRILGILYMAAGRSQSESRIEVEDNFIQFRSNIEKLLLRFNIQSWEWKTQEKNYFHPNVNLELNINNTIVGELGILHNKECDRNNLRKRPILFQLNLISFLEIINFSSGIYTFQPPSQFPQSILDISLVLDESESSLSYVQILKESGIPEINKVWVHNTFSGGNLEPGKLSVTYRIELLTYDKTFTHERIKEISDTLMNIAKDNKYTMR